MNIRNLPYAGLKQVEKEPLCAEAVMAKASKILMDTANPSMHEIMLADALVNMATELACRTSTVRYEAISICSEEPSGHSSVR